MILIQFSTVSYVKTNTLIPQYLFPLTFSYDYHMQKFKGAFIDI